MTIGFARLTAQDGPRLAHLSLAPGQAAFVSRPEARLARLQPSESAYAILSGAEIVGSLIIDPNYAKDHDFARPGEAGLRSVVIDAAKQGMELGKAAMAALPDLIAEHHPDVTALVLTVNCRNPVARPVYLKAGFQDAGEIYHGGRSGPQYVLRLPLPASAAHT